MAQARRITQETFDAVVQENLDEFGMEPDEAVADAVTQFESQGVDLANIVRRVPGAPDEAPVAHPAVTALSQLDQAVSAPGDASAVAAAASALHTALTGDDPNIGAARLQVDA